LKKGKKASRKVHNAPDLEAPPGIPRKSGKRGKKMKHHDGNRQKKRVPSRRYEKGFGKGSRSRKAKKIIEDLDRHPQRLGVWNLNGGKSGLSNTSPLPVEGGDATQKRTGVLRHPD